MKPLSLRKSKKILLGVYQLWRRKKKKILPAQAGEIRKDLEALQQQILDKNPSKASELAFKCEGYGTGILKKSSFEKAFGFVFALLFALVAALVIRQMWFEPYEIPSGSMRPTLKERDRLVVSKTTFGINVPFTPNQFYFDPDLVQRSGIGIFTVENMPVQDADARYFFLFPGKKRFVKRMMGLPGDTVYFYGGKIFGIDSQGRDISAELQRESLSYIDHVPFLHFDGHASLSEPFRTPIGNGYRMAIVHQMNEPVARLTADSNNRLEGEMISTSRIHNRGAPFTKNYADLWGIGNYAVARIVSKDEVRSHAEKNGITLGDEALYLELMHTPDLKNLMLGRDMAGRLRPQFRLRSSILPLTEANLKKIFENLYTGRFVVKNGHAARYVMQGGGHNLPTHYLTRLEGVPDGVYEFYNGQGVEILWGGVTKKLGPNHPLQKFSSKFTRKLFNYGIDFDKRVLMQSTPDTGRFGYFRGGDLYLMGAPVFKKGEPALEAFVEQEETRASSANPQNPYVPFLDKGPPRTKEGKIDVEMIRQYGLLIPPRSYLALGDNFAMSGDSRVFGFVPEKNLRGSPSFIFWPPGKRFGPPVQPPNPWFSVPNLIIWSLALLGFILWRWVHRRNYQLPLNFDR